MEANAHRVHSAQHSASPASDDEGKEHDADSGGEAEQLLLLQQQQAPAAIGLGAAPAPAPLDAAAQRARFAQQLAALQDQIAAFDQQAAVPATGAAVVPPPAPVAPAAAAAASAAAGGAVSAADRALAAVTAQNAALQQQLQRQQQQMQQQQQLMQQLQQAASIAPSLDNAQLMLIMQQNTAALVEAAEKRQAQATARTVILQAMGSCPTFSGKATVGSNSSLHAHEWLLRCRDYFRNREEALGLSHDSPEADRARVLTAVPALLGDAHRWYSSLPAAEKPLTWAVFEERIRKRYCNGAAEERLRLDVLTAFVHNAAKLREKFTLAALESFVARFQEIANEIPDSFATIHSKLSLLAQGLPARYAETILREDAKRPVPALHEVVNAVVAKAAFKEGAAAYAGSSHAAALNSVSDASADDIALCVQTFGVDRGVAATYLAPQEGWTPYNTSGGFQSPATSPAQSSASPDSAAFAQLLAAFSAQRGGAGPSRGAPPGQSKRRLTPSEIQKAVPQELATARKEAGLCIKCGIEKYEPGGKGHNARTCQRAIDPKTSVAEGVKKASF